MEIDTLRHLIYYFNMMKITTLSVPLCLLVVLTSRISYGVEHEKPSAYEQHDKQKWHYKTQQPKMSYAEWQRQDEERKSKEKQLQGLKVEWKDQTERHRSEHQKYLQTLTPRERYLHTLKHGHSPSADIHLNRHNSNGEASGSRDHQHPVNPPTQQPHSSSHLADPPPPYSEK